MGVVGLDRGDTRDGCVHAGVGVVPLRWSGSNGRAC